MNDNSIDLAISSYTPFSDQETTYDSTEIEPAEIYEHEAAKTSSAPPKTCEGLYCWGKTVLNSQLGINLSINNSLDEPAKKAIGEFQAKYNLEQTKKIDPATERKLLECDVIQKKKGTAGESEAINIINLARTKIEDWTKQAAVEKKEITNFYQ